MGMALSDRGDRGMISARADQRAKYDSQGLPPRPQGPFLLSGETRPRDPQRRASREPVSKTHILMSFVPRKCLSWKVLRLVIKKTP